MAEFKAGSLVWVQMKNGSWWPGRIMGQDELSSKQVQLLGRQNSSVNWYNLDSKCIKAFRCSEFDDFIKRAESLKASPLRKLLKYAHRTNAILHALELESTELGNKRKTTDCRVEAHQNGPVCRSKRSRCVYLPIGSKNSSECTSFHAQPLPPPVQRRGDSYQSNSSENNYSSSSGETYSSNSYSGTDEVMKQLSGCCSKPPGSKNNMKHEEISSLTPKGQTAADNVAPKWKMTPKLKHLNQHYGDGPYGQTYTTCRDAIHDKTNPSNVEDDAVNYYTSIGCHGKQSKKLMNHIYSPLQYQDGGLEIPRRQTRSASSRKMLIDVKLTAEAHYQGPPVPLVSLVSKTKGKSVIGYPVEVEALKEGSAETIFPTNVGAGNEMLDCKGTLLLPSVWKTARRTPVAYLPTPTLSIRTNFQDVNVRTNDTHAWLGTRDNNFLPKEKLAKQMTSRIFSNRMVNEDFEITCLTDLKPEENLPNVVTCVPVKLIFSRLVAAIGQQPEAEMCA